MFRHLMTRTQLARVTHFIHRPKSLLARSISCSQTLSLPHFSTAASAYSRRPVTLPEDISRNVVVLSCESSAKGGVCHVYVVGTCHESKESCRQVQAIVNFLKPQVIFLGLCSGRLYMPYEKHLKIASELDVIPGSEFHVAYEEAIKYGGRVALGDRPIQITEWRIWSKMPLWYIPKLVYFSLFRQDDLILGDINKMAKAMDDNDNDTLTRALHTRNKEFPALAETLVHERDQYMSCTLLQVARENSSVVAVVGWSHLQGIKKHWKQPVVIEELMTVPRATLAIRIGVAVAVAVAVAAIYIYTVIALTIRIKSLFNQLKNKD